MKALFCCLNAKYIHRSSAPWCLAAGVREFGPQGAECKVMESTVNADMAQFLQEILQEKPDLVTFTCYIWNIGQTLALCRAVKAQCGCLIAVGGPEVAYRAEALLEEEPAVDYVLRGEGEFAFPPFLKMLAEGGEPAAVEGLTYRAGTSVHSVPEGRYTADPPSPFCKEYLETLQGRICYLETSRGCPFRCAFCLSGRLAPFRFFSNPYKDLLKLAQSGSRTVKLVDRTFNADVHHANGILQFILEHYGKEIPEGVCFHFEIAGDILKESTFALLERMPYGAVQLEIGMQSFHEPTLEAICRRTDTQKLKENIKRLISFGNMHIHIDLIAGLTGEGAAEFAQSFRTAYSLGAQMLQLGFLKLLHGAPMREEAEKYPCTFKETPPYEVSSTPWLSPVELGRLKRCEDALDRLYNSGRFRFSLTYLTKEIGIDPFALFMDFGNAVAGGRLSLEEYALRFYTFFAPHCDAAALRELVVADLLCSTSASQIPKELRILDPRHKRAASLLGATGKKKVLIMERHQKILLTDPASPRDLWGRFPHRFYPLSVLDE